MRVEAALRRLAESVTARASRRGGHRGQPLRPLKRLRPILDAKAGGGGPAGDPEAGPARGLRGRDGPAHRQPRSRTTCRPWTTPACGAWASPLPRRARRGQLAILAAVRAREPARSACAGRGLGRAVARRAAARGDRGRAGAGGGARRQADRGPGVRPGDDGAILDFTTLEFIHFRARPARCSPPPPTWARAPRACPPPSGPPWWPTPSNLGPGLPDRGSTSSTPPARPRRPARTWARPGQDDLL